MRITRREILKTIRTEKLAAEHPIQLKRDLIGLGYYDNTCKVCAVGAVLRQKGIHNCLINTKFRVAIGLYNSGFDGNLENAFANKNYLCALSIKFEKLAKQYGVGAKTKKKLAQFVKVNFPKVIKVQV